MFAQHDLPAQTTAIIGRERETEDLRRLLLADDIRLLTLTGPGGIGKTRLAIHIASLLADSFDDGILFIPLAHLTDPAAVLAAIARELGLQADGATPLRDSLFSFLRRRRMLLVLDNFEQIVDAAVDIAELLAHCPDITIVATSRIVLHVRGEHEFPVPPLALPEHDASAEALSQYAAVLLFIQRASAVRSDFKLTNANAPAVAEICARLDGLPLAIELAAARVKILTPQAMLPRLHNRLQLLKGGAVDLPQRQQTLRNTIAWSYELLEPHEQMLFRRLSVFQGYWNLEAAEAVCGMEDILEGVQSLVDKSMVQQREMQNGEQYFMLLETLREFALEHLQQQEAASELFARHAEYYLALAEGCRDDQSDEVFTQWVTAVEYSFVNMQAAFHRLIEKGVWEEAGRMFSALLEYWYMRGTTGEAARWLKHLLPHLQDMSVPVRCAVYTLAAYFTRDSGNMTEAINYYREIQRLLDGTEYTQLHSTATGNLAITLAFMGDRETAQTMFDELLVRLRSSGNIFGTARTLLNYAHLAELTGRNDAAIAALEESTRLLRSIGQYRRTAQSLASLAALHSGSRPAQARRLAEEALAVCSRFGDRRSELRALIVIGTIAMAEGKFAECGEYFLRSLKPARDAGTTRMLIPVLLNFTDLFLRMSAHEPAVMCFAAARIFMRDFAVEYRTTSGTEYDEEEQQLRELAGEELFDRVWRQTALLSAAQIEAQIRTALQKHPGAAPVLSIPETEPAHSKPSSVVSNTLTSRETEILRLLARGLSNKEIGEQLFISERTVHAHVRSIYSKLDISSRSAATRFALENGM